MKVTVEPIEFERPASWGDMDPATKELTGSYNGKSKGACKPSESIVTELNGFTNIVVLDKGNSPLKYVRVA